MCVASTGLIAPSVNAEKEWSAVRYQDAAQPHVAVTYQRFVTCVRAGTFHPRCAGNDLAIRPRRRDNEWSTAALRSGAKSSRATVMLIAYALQRWEVRNGALDTSN